MKNFYQKKVILITGATSGIGADLAKLLTSLGSTVIAIGLKEPLMQELKADCVANEGKLIGHLCDVTDLAKMEKIAEMVQAEVGTPDIIIANAGLGGVNPADTFDYEIDHKIMSVNYFGMVNTFGPYLKKLIEKRNGQLVGIASLAGFRGMPMACSYSASKSAQIKLLESWRVDLKKHNIKVNCICPGFIKTPMTNHEEFPLPFMVDVRDSSWHILKAIYQNRSLYLYPFPMKLVTYLNRMLPNWLFDFILPIVMKKKNGKETKPKIF
ncbi:MAG: SDR family NAD(P)-dependent oxidoreductase [Bacteriovoracaceae bacterium]